LLSEIIYSSYVAFSPYGSTQAARESVTVRNHLKSGREELIRQAIAHLKKNNLETFDDVFGEDVIFVPAPRSSLLLPDSVWPSMMLSKVLLSEGLGKDICPCLKRTAAVPRSSTAKQKGRPRTTTIQHYDSMEVERDLIDPDQIVVVDDIVTKGAMLVGSVSRVQEAFPNSNVKSFCLLRTFSFDNNKEINRLIDPIVSSVVFYPSSGKVWRND